jgi:hypothetical protein
MSNFSTLAGEPYSLSNDCTGTLTIVLADGNTRAYEIAAVNGGAEIEFAEKGGASVAAVGYGTAKRQPATCDSTTIAGDFGVRFNRVLAAATKSPLELGGFAPAESAGLIHFDPPNIVSDTSHLTGVTGGIDSFTGALKEPKSYSVISNCTGTLTVTDSGGQTKELGMAIVEDGANIEIWFANITTTGSIVGEGIAKKQ